MRKKPTKSQMRRIKLMTVATKPIDTESNEQVVAALVSLQASSGWAVVEDVLKDNLRYLEDLILTGTDPFTHLQVNEQEIEKARLKRELTIDFRDTPKKIIDELTKGEIRGAEYDPYYNVDDIATAKNRRGV